LTTAGFVLERLEHKVIESVLPDDEARLATWNFVAVKP
jgi:hypothetical protein